MLTSIELEGRPLYTICKVAMTVVLRDAFSRGLLSRRTSKASELSEANDPQS